MSSKSSAVRSLRQELEALKHHFVQLQDAQQTKKHIIQDKAEKLEKMRVAHSELKLKSHAEQRAQAERIEQLQSDRAESRQLSAELMGKLKSVCAGYKALKHESGGAIEQLKAQQEQMAQQHQRLQEAHSATQQKCQEMHKALEQQQHTERELRKELSQRDEAMAERKGRLDCMIERNSDLNQKCKQSQAQVAEQQSKMAETHKLAAMISSLMLSNAQS